MSLLARAALSGAAASVSSAAAAAVCSRLENGHAARPMNAVTHIVDGGPPPADDGPHGRNTALGFAIHTAASVWWALFYEALGGGPRAAAGVAAVAYFVDYYVVDERFRPGFEAHLSRRSLLAVYAALAAGFAAASRLTPRR